MKTDLCVRTQGPYIGNNSSLLDVHVYILTFINHALLEPLEEYRLSDEIPRLPLEDQYLVVAEYDVYKRLSNLNAAKAGDPNGICNWIQREHSEFLGPYPVSVILNASFKEQQLPKSWKLAAVTPLPKSKPVKEIKGDFKEQKNSITSYHSPYFLKLPKRNGANHLIFQLEFSVFPCKW